MENFTPPYSELEGNPFALFVSLCRYSTASVLVRALEMTQSRMEAPKVNFMSKYPL